MGRNERRLGSGPEPVERIELSGEHLKVRIVLAVLFLALGVGLIGFTVFKLLTPEAGWTTIEADAGRGITDAGEFVFLYELEEKTAAAEKRALTSFYTQLSRTAYELFHTRQGFPGVNNLYAINHHPNEILEVDGALYAALSVMERSGSRALYLGPVCERYTGLFSCDNDTQLADYDPRLSEDVRREYARYAAWAADPAMLDLELLGENRVRLKVSEELLRIARQEELETFLDFGWMKNAFVADYLAGELIAHGYTRGAISSYDGFVRCLDNSGRSYSFQVSHRQDDRIYPAAVLEYRGAISLVCLRDYPMSSLDAYRTYVLSSGQVRTTYLDPADGMCRSAVHDLLCLSPSLSCAELALAVSGVFIADELDGAALAALTARDIRSIWCENASILYTGEAPILTDLYAGDDKTYAVTPFKP